MGIARLITPQVIKRHRRILVCKSCLPYLDGRGTKSGHKIERMQGSLYRLTVRNEISEKTKLHFKDHTNVQKVRFAIYCDFQSFGTHFDCDGNPDLSWTSHYQRHSPYIYVYISKESENVHFLLRMYRGEDASKHLMSSVVQVIQMNDDILFYDKKTNESLHKRAKTIVSIFNRVSHLQRKGFPLRTPRFVDHNHGTDAFKGAANRTYVS
jgi:hypothetical protein